MEAVCQLSIRSEYPEKYLEYGNCNELDWESAVLYGQSLDAAQFNDLHAVVCPYLVQHVVDMVSHGLLRKIQLRGNFLVGETPPDQLHKLLLSLSQPKVGFYVK